MNPLFKLQYFYNDTWQIAALFSLLTIFIFCLWSVYSDRINDGLFGRALYIVAALACAAGLMHMSQGTYPQRTTITIFVSIALLVIRRMFIFYFWDTIRAKYFIELKRGKAARRAQDGDK